MIEDRSPLSHPASNDRGSPPPETLAADFLISADNAVAYLRKRGFLRSADWAEAVELGGGVSATVVAVRTPGGEGLVVKQARARMKVADEWFAPTRRNESEVAAIRICASMTPDCVPAVVDVDPEHSIFVMRELPRTTANWQADIAAGRVHVDAGTWAGSTLGTWHTASNDAAVILCDFDLFERQRLQPFHETVMERLPHLATAVNPYLEDLRTTRCAFVHGDFAMKNVHVGRTGRYVLDFEVAHHGNPIFDLAFFLSYVVLSAIRWPRMRQELQGLGAGFLSSYFATVGASFHVDRAWLTGHTACLVLARTDGKSPASFLGTASQMQARQIGEQLLLNPARGIWQWE